MHDRKHFHKYVSAQTALRILDSRTLRWSAASRFNDPFDVQIDLRFGFDQASLARAITAEVDRVVYSDTEPVGDASHPMFRMLKEGWRSHAQFDRTTFRQQADLLASRVSSREYGIQERSKLEFSKFLGELRILCVSEEHDNILLWAHYADHHRGAVLRLGCVPERNSALCSARQVDYTRELPVLADLEDWIRRLTGQGHLEPPEEKVRKYILTKSLDWAYEREWRVFMKPRRDDGEGYVDIAIHPEEIEAIYLGCRIDPRTRVEIAGRLTGALSHVELLQAKKSPTKFALEFDLMAAGGSAR